MIMLVHAYRVGHQVLGHVVADTDASKRDICGINSLKSVLIHQ